MTDAHQADSQYLAVWKIGKWRDLPKDFKPAFEHMEGAIPDVAYENGKFYKLVNHWTRYGWPEVEKIELGKDDVLVRKKGGGVEGLLSGKPVRDTYRIDRETLADVVMRIDPNGRPMAGALQADLDRAKNVVREETEAIIAQARLERPDDAREAKLWALKLALKRRDAVLMQAAGK